MARARKGAVLDPAERARVRTRRRFARRQWRRRWLAWKPLLAAVLVLACVAGASWLLLASKYLAVDRVDITGAEYLTEGDIRSAAQVPQGRPLARVDLAAIERRIEGLAPVADAAVARSWPHTISIEVTERAAVAVVDVGAGVRGMDAQGVLFRKYDPAPASLPLVKTTGSTGGEALREAARVLDALPATLARRVQHLSVVTIDQVWLVLRDGRTVLWGSAEESDRKAEVLVALLGQKARSYDVSVPGQPTTSQQPPSPPVP